MSLLDALCKRHGNDASFHICMFFTVTAWRRCSICSRHERIAGSMLARATSPLLMRYHNFFSATPAKYTFLESLAKVPLTLLFTVAYVD